MEKITENVHHLPDLVGGPTLILADNYAILVDTGLPGDEEQILGALEQLGRKRSDLKHILLTHADPDHVGGLATIRSETGAEVYATPHEADVIEGKEPMRNGDILDGVSVDYRVEPGSTIDLHGGIQVVETHGHTSGHVAFYVVSDDVLIAGDCMTNTDGLTGSLPQFTANPDQAREAVAEAAAVKPSSVVFGHGPSVVGGAADQLDELAKRV